MFEGTLRECVLKGIVRECVRGCCIREGGLLTGCVARMQ